MFACLFYSFLSLHSLSFAVFLYYLQSLYLRRPHLHHNASNNQKFSLLSMTMSTNYDLL